MVVLFNFFLLWCNFLLLFHVIMHWKLLVVVGEVSSMLIRREQWFTSTCIKMYWADICNIVWAVSSICCSLLALDCSVLCSCRLNGSQTYHWLDGLEQEVVFDQIRWRRRYIWRWSWSIIISLEYSILCHLSLVSSMPIINIIFNIINCLFDSSSSSWSPCLSSQCYFWSMFHNASAQYFSAWIISLIAVFDYLVQAAMFAALNWPLVPHHSRGHTLLTEALGLLSWVFRLLLHAYVIDGIS